MYRISEDEVRKQCDEYRKNYPPFVPFTLKPVEQYVISSRFNISLSTQNGADTDDYGVDDNNKVERYIGDLPVGSKVLILGTGAGREILVAKDLGYKVCGTTFGTRNVYFAKKYLGLGDDEIIECANEVLPFSKFSFDVVAGFQVFEHAIAPMLFLMEQYRILRNGGKLLLEWPPPNGYTMGENPHHQICYVPGQAKALLEKSGFVNVRVFYDNKESIPDSDMWSGNQNKMLVVEGFVDHSRVPEHVRRHINVG